VVSAAPPPPSDTHTPTYPPCSSLAVAGIWVSGCQRRRMWSGMEEARRVAVWEVVWSL
jgi:hypothetical protein